jgi:tetratricopeptide (TPR) repeat protein
MMDGRTVWIWCLSATVLAAGCKRSVAWLDQRDRSLPLVQRAAERAAAGDAESAIRLYAKALEQAPDAARAHLDLAFLLHDYRKDYIGAVYHYRRYLELRPATEKNDMVSERIRLAEQLFAANVLGPNRLAEAISKLQRENRALRADVEDLTRRLAISRQGSDTEAEAPPQFAREERTEAPPARRGGGTHRVKPGDSLSSIAVAVYDDAQRWREIQRANSDILGNTSQLKVGQVLVIP